jgi:hypothetical protein
MRVEEDSMEGYVHEIDSLTFDHRERERENTTVFDDIVYSKLLFAFILRSMLINFIACFRLVENVELKVSFTSDSRPDDAWHEQLKEIFEAFNVDHIFMQ